MGAWVAAFRRVIGGWDGLRCRACPGPPRCSPCFRPGVQFLPACVHFSAKCVQFLPGCVHSPARCVHFPAGCVQFLRHFAPNVSTRPAHVSTRKLDGGFVTGRSARLEGELAERSLSAPDGGGGIGLVARKTLTPTLSHREREKMGGWSGDGPGVSGGRPGGRRGLRRGPGGRTGGRGRCGGIGRCRP